LRLSSLSNWGGCSIVHLLSLSSPISRFICLSVSSRIAVSISSYLHRVEISLSIQCSSHQFQLLYIVIELLSFASFVRNSISTSHSCTNKHFVSFQLVGSECNYFLLSILSKS
jgi:hypothetical protein